MKCKRPLSALPVVTVTVPEISPEHGGDDFPGERQNPEPHAGHRHGLQEAVKLVMSEGFRGKKGAFLE